MPDLTRRNLMAQGAASFAALSLFGVQNALGQAPAFAPPPTPDEVFRDPGVPVLGNPAGDVTIVEFFDYQCPFCKRAHPDLVETVAADGNVRLVMKDWPIFGPSSLHASRMVLAAAGTPAYEEGMEAVFETEGRLTDGQVDAALRGAGLDPARMLAAYEADPNPVEAIIDRNGRQAMGLRLSGTPGFIIGTRVYAGMMDAAGLRQAIAEKRAGATL